MNSVIKNFILKNGKSFSFSLFNNTLCVTTECPLKCSACPIWKNPDQLIDEHMIYQNHNNAILNAIKSDQLFQNLSSPAMINIIGGEPLWNADLPIILQYFKNKKTTLRLWTTGIIPSENFEIIAPWTDEIFLYLPSLIPDTYLEITGFDYLEQVKDQLHFLLELGLNVTLNAPVYPDTIQDMPSIYDFAFENKVKLLFHYSLESGFSSESIFYLNRFNRIKNVLVQKIPQYPLYACSGFPNIASSGIKNKIQNFLTSFPL